MFATGPYSFQVDCRITRSNPQLICWVPLWNACPIAVRPLVGCKGNRVTSLLCPCTSLGVASGCMPDDVILSRDEALLALLISLFCSWIWIWVPERTSWAMKRGSWKNEVGTGSLTQAFMVLEVLSVFWAAILCCLVQESTLGKRRQKMMPELSTGSYEEGARWRRGEENHQASALTCQMLRTIRNTDCWSSKGSGLRTGFQSPHCWGETESPLHAAHSSSAATAVLQRSFRGQALGVWLHDVFKLSMPKAIVPQLQSSRPGCCEANYHTQSPCPSPHSTTSAKTHILRCFTFRSNLPFLWIKKQHLWSNN